MSKLAFAVVYCYVLLTAPLAPREAELATIYPPCASSYCSSTAALENELFLLAIELPDITADPGCCCCKYIFDMLVSGCVLLKLLGCCLRPMLLWPISEDEFVKESTPVVVVVAPIGEEEESSIWWWCIC